MLANHKMVHESLNRSYGYTRIELWPAELGVKFEKVSPNPTPNPSPIPTRTRTPTLPLTPTLTPTL